MLCDNRIRTKRYKGGSDDFRATISVRRLVLLAASIQFAPMASAQSGDGWKVLLDGKSMDGWNKVGGETNWRVEDGAVVADKLGSKDAAWLVSQ